MRAPATSPNILSACFPAACSLAATFDTDLARRVGEALAEEAHDKGANCILGPTVCLHRHPLGGRNFESFSEDPLLTGRMASQIIQGLQRNGVAATIKHFVANEQETARTTVNEIISERALREIYLRPFEIAVKEANPWAVMTAYNLVNGTHCDAHPWLLQEILRGSWGWDGMVMSDWGGTNSVAEALKTGLDLEMPGPPRKRKTSSVLEALDRGEISESDIDSRVTAVLKLATKLEALKPAASASPHKDGGNRPEHQALIREAGARGMVLLKNEDKILPLSPGKVKGKRIALIGFAREALAHGGGSASVRSYYRVTPEEGLRAALGKDVEFTYAKGAHRERLLPPLTSESEAGTITDLDGQPGFTCHLYEHGQETPVIVKRGYPSSAYNPLGSRESYDKTIEIIGDFTPTETGAHYIASSGFGPTRVFVDDQLIYEQKNNTTDPMGSLFNAAPEPEIQHHFTAGQTNRIRFRTESPVNIGLEVLEGRSGGRLGFWLQSTHDADLHGEAAQIAKDADYAIVFTGHDPQWETEGQDQASFHLPRDQDGLVAAVAASNPNTIVVNSTGVAVAMPWLKDIKAMVQAWFPGQECGNSISDLLTGRMTPEGRLPSSFPRFIEDAPAFRNFPGQEVNGQLQVEYAEGVFIGYRHYDRVPRDKLNFPFGFGLSYTKFEGGGISVHQQTASSVVVKTAITNAGDLAGGIVLQLFIGKREIPVDHPIKTLVAFKRIYLEAGGRAEVDMEVQLRDMAYFDETQHQWVVEAGEYELSLVCSPVEAPKTVAVVLDAISWPV